MSQWLILLTVFLRRAGLISRMGAAWVAWLEGASGGRAAVVRRPICGDLGGSVLPSKLGLRSTEIMHESIGRGNGRPVPAARLG